MEELTLIPDEEIQKVTDEYAPVWEINGRQLSKVEILQRQHARLRAIAKAQLEADKKKEEANRKEAYEQGRRENHKGG